MFDISFRVLIVLISTIIGFFYSPKPDYRLIYGVVGFIIGLIIIIFLKKIKKTELTKFWGGLVGFILGVILGFICSEIVSSFEQTKWLKNIVILLFPLAGLYFGIEKKEWFKPSEIKSMFARREEKIVTKIIDTSAIIDGRIADICETGFIEGNIVVPSFIIEELQRVADSTDPLKRQRGRRGFDILQKLKKCPTAMFEVVEIDYIDIKEVDQKLLQLAKDWEGIIITLDFNLNKVAEVHGIEILNINELANALKPVVLPGEKIKTHILKEGKEKDQGVAYLEDGTMVVVDNARKMIGQSIEVTVTSVLQTVAGKMIFGRFEEE